MPPAWTSGLARVGVPAILKTASFGYDGKGQVRVTDADAAAAAWATIGWQPAVLEAVVDFACEVSVVVARGADGAMVDYGAIENSHRNHILDVSVWPARVPAETARKAVALARAACEALDVVGVLCVEMFVTHDGDVVVNELAPRPHNSGHLTIDAHVTCQFEQQLRAVCGLPLGTTAARVPAAAMANLLGDVWAGGEPDWAAALAVAGRETPPVRQGRGTPRPEDGSPDGHRGVAGRGRSAGSRGSAPARPVGKATASRAGAARCP